LCDHYIVHRQARQPTLRADQGPRGDGEVEADASASW